ncbi:MAG: triose-phosphate isomerase [Moraxella sp.]|uniref:triose-phosphate isomerase n=1 Tax=Moraxella sp. TaxID=479 RepID=UPI0026DC640E|nr:triose-phosphate isomerase [Moraxella sp.]MDO4449617.1 triose-phosphate isomerase [Moraxella sp.]
MHKKYVIGNWKLNPATQKDAHALAQDLQKFTKQSANATVQVGCTPSFVHLHQVAQILSDSPLWVGVQDVSAFGATGAFTGDVSAVQVADLGAKFTLIGHSERRQYHGETDEILTAKITNAFNTNLSVIYCIGETKDEYERGDTEQVLEAQLALLGQFAKDIEDTPFAKLIIAYEPVWAIGTGLTPTLNEIEKIHTHIKHYLHTQFGVNLPILYGGSVNDKNASEFAKSTVIDGVLVGGASLKIDSFATIIDAFS